MNDNEGVASLLESARQGNVWAVEHLLDPGTVLGREVAGRVRRRTGPNDALFDRVSDGVRDRLCKMTERGQFTCQTMGQFLSLADAAARFEICDAMDETSRRLAAERTYQVLRESHLHRQRVKPGSLAKRQREITIIKRLLDGLPISQIARELGLSRVTVWRSLAAIRDRDASDDNS